ncbi:hypothetical protein PFI31113_03829 [Pandoraea fibrosis]|uniref:Uncharacterized protein n=1 Tax=Pandoraea fibrosis TaxID=1891094 RepID=A0A5E4XGI8_9BURK|nr:hypothetical protein PFI31113_03829 [Pandoraea fibrosis]
MLGDKVQRLTGTAKDGGIARLSACANGLLEMLVRVGASSSRFEVSHEEIKHGVRIIVGQSA